MAEASKISYSLSQYAFVFKYVVHSTNKIIEVWCVSQKKLVNIREIEMSKVTRRPSDMTFYNFHRRTQFHDYFVECNDACLVSEFLVFPHCRYFLVLFVTSNGPDRDIS